MKNSKTQILGGAMLVAGTSIGAGMLALPVVSSQGGFLPACAIYSLCWVFMTITGLFLTELCLKMPPESNLISLAQHFLGTKGKILCWMLYLFLFYSLSVAYLTVGGQLIQQLFGGKLSSFLATILFLLLLAPFVYRGAKTVDLMNRVLMGGLILSYIGFVFFGLPLIQGEYLLRMEWKSAFWALPVIFTAFSYQGVIPSLVTYLDRDPKKLRLAICMGTTMAFGIYIIWQMLILGIIPVEGAFGLAEAKSQGTTAIPLLKHHTSISHIYALGGAFSFFAITTSFLGVTLGLFDFLADGLSLTKKGMNKALIAALVFLPPLFVSLINPHLFLVALGYAGGIGCALLLGLMPTWMVWHARYRRKAAYEAVYVFPGGKVFFLILFLFVFFELGIEFNLFL